MCSLSFSRHDRRSLGRKELVRPREVARLRLGRPRRPVAPLQAAAHDSGRTPRRTCPLHPDASGPGGEGGRK